MSVKNPRGAKEGERNAHRHNRSEQASRAHLGGSSAGNLVDPVLDELDEILGPAPLLQGEDPEKYRALLTVFWNELKPTDVVEKMWVREIVHQFWLTNRLRRFQAAVIKLARRDAISEIRSALLGIRHMTEEDDEAVAASLRNAPPAFRRILDISMAKAGWGETEIEAAAVCWSMGRFESLEKIVRDAQKRITQIYRDIEERRDRTTARRLRDKVSNVEDAVIAGQDETSVSRKSSGKGAPATAPIEYEREKPDDDAEPTGVIYDFGTGR